MGRRRTAQGSSAHGQGLTIANSSVFDNAGPGMIVTGDRSRITNNVASNNGSDGIRVFGTGTIVSGNRAISNVQDGITVLLGENTQLTSNVANGNGERGFDIARPDGHAHEEHGLLQRPARVHHHLGRDHRRRRQPGRRQRQRPSVRERRLRALVGGRELSLRSTRGENMTLPTTTPRTPPPHPGGARACDPAPCGRGRPRLPAPRLGNERGADARAVVVSCGQTITASIVVSNDLDDCPGYGLIVGANGITLDLGGHTIDGDSNGVPDDGVSNGGFDNVKIQDGTITGFSFGVLLSSSADGNRIANVHADFNTYGIVVEAGSEDATITGISADGNKHGIAVSEADGLQVTNSSPSPTADGLEVANSTINGNGLLGISVTDADDVVISGTKAVSNATGISVDLLSRRAEIKTSVANSNRHDGILVEARTAKLTGNTALYNTELGIDADRRRHRRGREQGTRQRLLAPVRERRLRLSSVRSGAEKGEDGVHAPVLARVRREVELAEDAADVRLDGLARHEELLADPPVGPPLGDEREHLELARREGGERVSRRRGRRAARSRATARRRCRPPRHARARPRTHPRRRSCP